MNFFKQLFQSITNPKAIAEFRSQHVAKSVFYIFFLTFIMFIPIIYSAHYSYDYTRNTYDEFLTENDETIEIVESELVAQPVETYIHNGPGMLVVIDSTSDEVDPEEVDGPYIAFLKNEIEVSSGINEQSITYAEIGLENVSDDQFQAVISRTSSVAFVVTSIITYWMMTLGVVISISVLALLLRILSRIPGGDRNLTFGNYWTIAVYSTSIMAVFIAIMHSFGINIVAQEFITWMVSYIIASQAVKSIPSIKNSI